MEKYKNIAKIKAIEKANINKLLSINSKLDNKSGIYFLTRTDENNIHYFYIGQAIHILQRLCGHLTGYQHIDLSIKKRGFYSIENSYGWQINFIHYPPNELDKWEQYWILEYTKKGYQCRYNKTSGGQGVDGIPFLFTLHVTGWESSSLQKLCCLPVVKTYNSSVFFTQIGH